MKKRVSILLLVLVILVILGIWFYQYNKTSDSKRTTNKETKISKVEQPINSEVPFEVKFCKNFDDFRKAIIEDDTVKIKSYINFPLEVDSPEEWQYSRVLEGESSTEIYGLLYKDYLLNKHIIFSDAFKKLIKDYDFIKILEIPEGYESKTITLPDGKKYTIKGVYGDVQEFYGFTLTVFHKNHIPPKETDTLYSGYKNKLRFNDGVPKSLQYRFKISNDGSFKLNSLYAIPSDSMYEPD